MYILYYHPLITKELTSWVKLQVEIFCKESRSTQYQYEHRMLNNVAESNTTRSQIIVNIYTNIISL